MPTIGIIVCYFGTWPPWFPFFLKTCAWNPTVRFLLFTDGNAPGRVPANVTVIPFSLAAFNALATQQLGLAINVQAPYKLCDLRPAFGDIFEEYLRDFDFWGYSDVDVLFGDLRAFLTDDLLTGHDVIATREEYLSGHFTLSRNTEAVCRLYEASADYRRVFQSEQHFVFDECNYLWHYLLAGGSLFEKEADIDSMTHVVKRLAAEGAVRACFRNLGRERIDLKKTTAPWTIWNLFGEQAVFVMSDSPT